MMAANNEGSNPKTGGERRKRTVFTPAQIEILKKAFEENLYPGYKTREALARHIGVEEDRVHVWFQNRRARTPKRIGSRVRIGNHSTAPYGRSERTTPRSSLASSPKSSPGSSQNIYTQQYDQPHNFHYAENYRGAGFWQPPLNNTQLGEQLYAPQQQSSPELNPVHYQQAAIGGTGLCEASQASNCPYYGAEMVRQPPPSADSLSIASSSYNPWCAMGNYPAENPGQMPNVDGSGLDSQFFSSSYV